MHTTNLQKVRGSIMVAVPPAFIDQLQLKAGANVGLAVQHSCLVINPTPRIRYTLDELLAQCDISAEIQAEDNEWLNAQPVGSELL